MPNAIRSVVRNLLPPKLLHAYRVLRHLKLAPFERELALLPRFLDRNNIAVDVGANIGLMATVMSRGSKRVIAFEPHPGCAAHLRAIAIPNCEVIEAAASDHDGMLTLRVPGEHALGTVEPANPLAGQPDVAAFAIAAQAIDHALASRLQPGEAVSFIKIDVEGHEFAVLRGAERTLETHRPVLMIEIEVRHGSPVHDIFAWLSERGYDAAVTPDGAALQPIGPGDLQRMQASPASRPINNVLFFHRTVRASDTL